MAKEWFAVHTYSGYEQKVKANIEHLAAIEGFRDDVAEVIIPQETYIQVKGGKKKTAKKATIKKTAKKTKKEGKKTARKKAASGVYIYRMKTGEFASAKKMIFVR